MEKAAERRATREWRQIIPQGDTMTVQKMLQYFDLKLKKLNKTTEKELKLLKTSEQQRKILFDENKTYIEKQKQDFKSLDLDGDGTVTLQEYVKFRKTELKAFPSVSIKMNDKLFVLFKDEEFTSISLTKFLPAEERSVKLLVGLKFQGKMIPIREVNLKELGKGTYQAILEDKKMDAIKKLDKLRIRAIRNEFSAVDEDGSGEVTRSEIEAYFEKKAERRIMTEGSILQEVWAHSPSQRDKEIEAAIHHANDEKKRNIQRFLEIDFDGNGDISLQEYKLYRAISIINEIFITLKHGAKKKIGVWINSKGLDLKFSTSHAVQSLFTISEMQIFNVRYLTDSNGKKIIVTKRGGLERVLFKKLAHEETYQIHAEDKRQKALRLLDSTMRDKIKSEFNAIDTDGSNSIDEDEVRNYFENEYQESIQNISEELDKRFPKKNETLKAKLFSLKRLDAIANRDSQIRKFLQINHESKDKEITLAQFMLQRAPAISSQKYIKILYHGRITLVWLSKIEDYSIVTRIKESKKLKLKEYQKKYCSFFLKSKFTRKTSPLEQKFLVCANVKRGEKFDLILEDTRIKIVKELDKTRKDAISAEFISMDDDGNGSLTKDEILTYFEKKNKLELARIRQLCSAEMIPDPDKRQKHISKLTQNSADDYEKEVKFFLQMDENNDGDVSLEEFLFHRAPVYAKKKYVTFILEKDVQINKISDTRQYSIFVDSLSKNDILSGLEFSILQHEFINITFLREEKTGIRQDISKSGNNTSLFKLVRHNRRYHVMLHDKRSVASSNLTERQIQQVLKKFKKYAGKNSTKITKRSVRKALFTNIETLEEMFTLKLFEHGEEKVNQQIKDFHNQVATRVDKFFVKYNHKDYVIEKDEFILTESFRVASNFFIKCHYKKRTFELVVREGIKILDSKVFSRLNLLKSNFPLCGKFLKERKTGKLITPEAPNILEFWNPALYINTDNLNPGAEYDIICERNPVTLDEDWQVARIDTLIAEYLPIERKTNNSTKDPDLLSASGGGEEVSGGRNKEPVDEENKEDPQSSDKIDSKMIHQFLMDTISPALLVEFKKSNVTKFYFQDMNEEEKQKNIDMKNKLFRHAIRALVSLGAKMDYEKKGYLTYTEFKEFIHFLFVFKFHRILKYLPRKKKV